MAPNKVKVVHEEDIIPLRRLNKHKVPSSTVKLLKDSHKWNHVLTSNNRKSVLATIQGLTDAMSEEICEAITKIMDSLQSDVNVFTEKTVASLKKECDKGNINVFVRSCLLEAQDCAKKCYSFDEIHDLFHEKFAFDKEDTKALYGRFFEPKGGHNAYMQLSSIRAAQRKAENQVGEEEAEDKEELALEDKEALAIEDKEALAIEKKEALAIEDKEALAIEDKEALAIEKKEALAIEDKEALAIEDKEALAIEKKKELAIAIEKKELAIAIEKKGAFAIDIEKKEALPEKNEELAHKNEEALEQKVDEAEKLQQPVSSGDQIKHQARVQVQSNTETEEKKVSDSQVNWLMDALTRQKELFKEIKSYEREIATKDHLEPLQIRIIKKLESVGEKLTSGIGVALSEHHNSIKERIDSESEIRAANAVAGAVSDAVANVTSIKEKMSLCLVQGNNEEVFSMALGADDATLGWLLTRVNPYLLVHFPAEKQNIQSLLLRLARLVTAEQGEFSYVFGASFEMMLKKAVDSDLEITEEVREAAKHMEKKFESVYSLFHRRFTAEWDGLWKARLKFSKKDCGRLG